MRPQIERRKSSVTVNELEENCNFNQLTLDELEDYFDLIDIQEQLLAINPEMKHKKSFYNLISLILPCRIPKLKTSLILERDRLFAIALTEFNDNEHMNFRLLITIYEILLQKKGYFNEKINQLKNSSKLQNFVSTPSNNLEAPAKLKSFRKFKHIKSFKRNTFGNQSMRNAASASLKTNLYNDDYLNSQTNQYETKVKQRNKSVDSASPQIANEVTLNAISTLNVNSKYKYQLNDQEISDQQTLSNENSFICNDNSLDSFQTSLKSNLEYLSASGFSKQFTDSNPLNGNAFNQYNSTGHLSINSGAINNSYNNKKANYSSRHSLRSGIHNWAGSRKLSNSSYYSKRNSYSTLYNEKISITLFHRSIRYGNYWEDIGNYYYTFVLIVVCYL